MKYLYSIILVVILTSCATTTQYAKFQGSKKLNSNSEARIYILRPSILGASIKMKVFCNDKLIGKTGPKSYLSWNVKEGEYLIQTNSENKDYFTINAKAGKTYYIKQVPKIGILIARVGLESISAEEGTKLLKKLKQPKKINFVE